MCIYICMCIYIYTHVYDFADRIAIFNDAVLQNPVNLKHFLVQALN